ncbi:MAG TPA: TMEM14 family protein [Candidatus Polarisedimenticolia bacterium]|jgi:uncharacterized membrane protein (UPF0136 family)|nr:TMEM14 family protein [Candidatus Polarisedimenticolia bacterium]
MSAAAVTTFVYGALVLAGGWLGYRKASSLPSLITGAISAALLFLAGILSARGNPAGDRIALIVALVLAVFFGYRLARGRKFMPAGLMVVISVAVLVILCFCSFSRP